MRSGHGARALSGILFVIAAVACFATLDTASQYAGAAVPAVMALFFRYLVQTGASTALLLPLRGAKALRTEHPRYQLLRGLLMLATSFLAFFSLRHIPVAEFTAILMIVPLVVTVLAATTLHEHVSPGRWALVAGGFLGTLVIIRPGADTFSWAMLLPLGLVVSNAWFQVLTSRLARTDDPLTMHFYTGCIGLACCALLLPFFWAALPSWHYWLAIGVISLMGTVGHFFLILAYARAPAASVAPFQHCHIGFAMIGGMVMFGHVPDGWSLMGIAVIAVCGAAGAWLTVVESKIVVQPAEG